MRASEIGWSLMRAPTEKRRRESDLAEPQVAAVAVPEAATPGSEAKRQRTQEQATPAGEEEDEYGEELPAVEVVVEQTGAAAEASASAIGRVTHTVCVPK
jgi:hypothetical protein